jgi:hypothetical protein
MKENKPCARRNPFIWIFSNHRHRYYIYRFFKQVQTGSFSLQLRASEKIFFQQRYPALLYTLHS